MRTRSLEFRLAVLFALLTIILSGLLFVFSYSLTASTFGREEDQEIGARLLEFWAAYTQLGTELLEPGTFFDRYLPGREEYLLRVTTQDGMTLLLYVPEGWTGLSRSQIEERDPQPGDSTAVLRTSKGRSIRLASVDLPDGRMAQIGLDVSDRVKALRRFWSTFLGVAAPMTIVIVVVGFLFARRSLKPIGRLTSAIRSILDTGRMDHRIPPPGTRDDIERLVVIFNQMLERIQSLIAGMRESLDNATHDLRTPLTRLHNQVELALAAEDREQSRQAIAGAVRQAELLLTMVNTLMDIAEAERGAVNLQLERIDLSEVARDIAELYSYAADAKGVIVETIADAPVYARADVTRIRQVLANLLDNAVKYTPEGGRVRVETSYCESLAAGGATVRVSDTGVGISETDLPHIWRRLYRGDRSRSEPGLGLGLSLVRAIVQAHGGTMEVDSRPGVGSTFVVILPRQNITDL